MPAAASAMTTLVWPMNKGMIHPRRAFSSASTTLNGALGPASTSWRSGSRKSSSGRMQSALPIPSIHCALRQGVAPNRAGRRWPVTSPSSSPATAKPAAMPAVLRNVGDDDRAAALLRPAIVRSKRQDGGQAAGRTDGRQHPSDEQDLGRRRRRRDEGPERSSPTAMMMRIATRFQRSTQMPMGIEKRTSGIAAATPWTTASALSDRCISALARLCHDSEALEHGEADQHREADQQQRADRTADRRRGRVRDFDCGRWPSINSAFRKRRNASGWPCGRHRRRRAGQKVEAVERARPDVELGRHAGADQARGIVDVLVDEEVERRRSAMKVGGRPARSVARAGAA